MIFILQKLEKNNQIRNLKHCQRPVIFHNRGKPNRDKQNKLGVEKIAFKRRLVCIVMTQSNVLRHITRELIADGSLFSVEKENGH